MIKFQQRQQTTYCGYDDADLMVCYVSVGEWVPTFWRVKQPKNSFCTAWPCRWRYEVLFWKHGARLTHDNTSYPRRLESSTTLLWKHQILQFKCWMNFYETLHWGDQPKFVEPYHFSFRVYNFNDNYISSCAQVKWNLNIYWNEKHFKHQL
jgi:hypothetical protein